MSSRFDPVQNVVSALHQEIASLYERETIARCRDCEIVRRSVDVAVRAINASVDSAQRSARARR